MTTPYDSGPSHDAREAWLDALHANSWAVMENWLCDADLLALRQDILTLKESGKLSPAGIGRGQTRQRDTRVRADLISWHDPERPTVAQTPLFRALNELRVQLNRRFFLGLKRFESHDAVYPPGAHYQKHVDQFRNAGHRRVSFVLYLNRDWSATLGGALRIFDPLALDTVVADIYPHWGRAVVFFSDSVPHEVTTTRAERLSVVGWFRDDDASTPR